MVDCLYLFLAMLLQISQPCSDTVAQWSCYEQTHATWYNQHIFERVVYNRLTGRAHLGLPQGLDHGRLAGYVARPFASELGDVVLIEYNGGVFGPVLVADHAAPVATEAHGWASDQERSLSLNIRAEVDYKLATQMGITRYSALQTPVRVFRFHPLVNIEIRKALNAQRPLCPKLEP